MLPVMNNNLLKLIVGTADERYTQSAEYFRKTHFPQVMRSYKNDKLIFETTEEELFTTLQEVDNHGSRVYLIFGTTGSGKSELLCWIKDQWLLRNEKRPVIRISRTELNPQILIKKCFEITGIELDMSINQDRWKILLNKPITLINQIVWSTLAELLSSDEEILPMALMLRPEIEKNIVDFTKQIQRKKIKNSLELISKEQFEMLLKRTSLEIPLDYYLFRQTLSKNLDHFLFEGKDIAGLFKQLSSSLKQANIRPLLLIDDLVQSLNIYANDLLDQFITLEEGNWDVVIGLTPGSTQDTKSGQDLIKRIENLSTINDRVNKLWLSDESGKEFYSLKREQVVPYVTNYFKELKALQAMHYKNDFKHGTEELVDILLPLNEHLINRMYDAIPMGEGKLRYMLLNIKEFLRFFNKRKKNKLVKLLPLVKREKFAEHPDILLKTLAEWYAPEQEDSYVIPNALLAHFGYQEENIAIHLRPIVQNDNTESFAIENPINSDYQDEVALIRKWVEGNKASAEILDSVRLGAASLVNDITKAIHLSQRSTSRSTSFIQYSRVNNRSKYPIQIENNKIIRKTGFITITRSYTALRVLNFQKLKASDKVKVFSQISEDLETAMWVQQADFVHQNWKSNLEELLGLSLRQWSACLKSWICMYNQFAGLSWTEEADKNSPFQRELLMIAEECYRDWFLLRENMIDPFEINETGGIQFLEWLKKIQLNRNLEDYEIGGTSFYLFIAQLKENYQIYEEALQKCLKLGLKENLKMMPYLLSLNHNECDDLITHLKNLDKKSEYSYEDFKMYTRITKVIHEKRIKESFDQYIEIYNQASILQNEINILKGKLQAQLLTYFDLSIENMSRKNWFIEEKINIPVNQYEKLKNKLIDLTDSICILPEKTVIQVIEIPAPSTELSFLKENFLEIRDYASRLLQEEEELEVPNYLEVLSMTSKQELKNRVNTLIRKELEKAIIIEQLKIDLNYSLNIDTELLRQRIEKDIELRPAIKRHLKVLLEQGYSTLPPVQGNKLLLELREKFPNLLNALEVKMIMTTR